MPFAKTTATAASAAATVAEQIRQNPDPILLEIAQIQRDPKRFLMRTQINRGEVEKLKKAQAGGVDLDPVDVFEIDGMDGLWLVHGHHRFEANVQNGHTTIWAVVRKGTLLEAMKMAWPANSKHGAQTTDADNRIKIASYLEFFPQASSTEIANAIGVSVSFVSDERKKLEDAGAIQKPVDEEGNEIRMVTRKGKTYPQKVGGIGKKKTRPDQNGKVLSDSAISFPVETGTSEVTLYSLVLTEEQAGALWDILGQHNDQPVAQYILSKLPGPKGS